MSCSYLRGFLRSPALQRFHAVCPFGTTLRAFYPFIRPLTIVHFARRSRGHRAGCWAIDL